MHEPLTRLARLLAQANRSEPDWSLLSPGDAEYVAALLVELHKERKEPYHIEFEPTTRQFFVHDQTSPVAGPFNYFTAALVIQTFYLEI